MGIRSVPKRLTLSIVLLLYGDRLVAGNGEVCRTKPSHDVYVPSNDLSCREDVSDSKSFVIQRYGPRRSYASNYDMTGISSALLIAITNRNFISSAICEESPYA